MSATMLKLYDVHKTKFTHATRHVFYFVCLRHNENGGFYYSIPKTAKESQTCRSTVRRAVNQLEEIGLATSYKTVNMLDGSSTTNILFINGVDTWDKIYKSRKYEFFVPLDPITEQPMWFVVPSEVLKQADNHDNRGDGSPLLGLDRSQYDLETPSGSTENPLIIKENIKNDFISEDFNNSGATPNTSEIKILPPEIQREETPEFIPFDEYQEKAVNKECDSETLREIEISNMKRVLKGDPIEMITNIPKAEAKQSFVSNRVNTVQSSEAHSASQAKTKKTTNHKAKPHQPLIDAYREARKAKTHKTVGLVSPIEINMLKNLLKFFNDSDPDNELELNPCDIFNRWDDFVEYVRKHAHNGFKGFDMPTPDIGKALKHKQYAFEFLQDQGTSAPSGQPTGSKRNFMTEVII